jgi:hypothetical protein
MPAETHDFTGQLLDSSGLLYYHARYYDPALGRFISPDSVVPGSASGSLDGVSLKPLTVDFHEPGFASTLSGENAQPFWFRMDAQQRQQVGSPWGPVNPQALNRYAYVMNNPMKWTDPSGHTWYLSQKQAAVLALELRGLARSINTDPTIWIGYGTEVGSIGAEAYAARYPLLEGLMGGASRFFGLIGALVSAGSEALAHGADQINELAYLVELANGRDGVALMYADGGLYALNRSDRSVFYLNTPIWMDSNLPTSLQPGIINATPGEEFKGNWWFNADILAIRARLPRK